ncbi:Aspartate transaminase [Desulfurobacterium thermolithotrophum DSM 11699]|uniref:Aspartate transaminase n=1 Tax=Desulfurobacterium thermolithotrophum (strain DSM 11699 / BSA) TaxID=868864 RepID=F0S073_DESTD|nr:pyridoxal phosphate-dependent aminotransferase [Desulfurobacterium thermolithotrophum]ADY73752.1 Aspartate transaminase [Desulfurobacterium thermolithotrophum DSM 11699]
MKLSKRVLNMSPSPTMAITAKAKEMRAKGIDVIGFGAGEPDFDTPCHVKEAAKRAIDEGFTKYTPPAGIPELRKAVADKLKKENNIDYDPSEIVITDGAKQALFALMLSVIEKGDEVIIPAPYWVTYPEQVKFAGGKPVFVETKEENNFSLTLEDIKPAVTDKTKLLILCTPNNPTGSVVDKDELEKIGNFCAERGIIIASDECYEKLTYDGFKHVSIASLSEKIKSITVTINALSKAFSMTGWRVGYAAGPKDIINSMIKINSQSISNVNSIAQKAAVAALTGSQEFLKDWLKAFDERRRFMVEKLNEIPGVKCLLPKGAFYAFPNVKELIERAGFKDDFQLADYLLEKAKIAVVPGTAFGMPGYLRLSYATSMDNIKEGLERFEKAVEELLND